MCLVFQRFSSTVHSQLSDLNKATLFIVIILFILDSGVKKDAIQKEH